MVGGKGGKVFIWFLLTHNVIRVAGSSGREVRPQEAAYSLSSLGGKGGRTPIGHIKQARDIRVSGRAGKAVIGSKVMSSSFRRGGRGVVISVMLL